MGRMRWREGGIDGGKKGGERVEEVVVVRLVKIGDEKSGREGFGLYMRWGG